MSKAMTEVRTMLSRRQFIEKTGRQALKLGTSSLLVSPLFLGLTRSAFADRVSDLRASLAPGQGTVLTSADRRFAEFRAGFNTRLKPEVLGTPEAILLAQSPEGIGIGIQWARANHIPIRMRSGGHSYEGFSQGPGLVIDVRGMNAIQVNRAAQTSSVGAGARLGEVYAENFKQGLVVPAGSCGTVGVAGLVTGGGMGLLSRKFGLTCDNLIGAQMVDAQGRILELSDSSNPDLFWAIRGGGGGTFGVCTRFDFRAHPIGNVTKFILTFSKESPDKVISAWQKWMQNAPDSITSVCNISGGNGKIAVRIVGQMVGSEAELRSALKDLPAAQDKPENIKSMPLIQSVLSLGGKTEGVVPEWFKGSSDYAFRALDDADVDAIVAQVKSSPGGTLLFDSYGGAISRVDPRATAFNHRDALFSVQYYISSPQSLAWLRSARAALNSRFSGKSGANRAYVNYCDLDITDWKSAYWGENYARLSQIKRAYDPENVFRHSQSVTP